MQRRLCELAVSKQKKFWSKIFVRFLKKSSTSSCYEQGFLHWFFTKNKSSSPNLGWELEDLFAICWGMTIEGLLGCFISGSSNLSFPFYDIRNMNKITWVSLLAPIYLSCLAGQLPENSAPLIDKDIYKTVISRLSVIGTNGKPDNCPHCRQDFKEAMSGSPTKPAIWSQDLQLS